MVELRLLLDAMGERLVRSKAWLFEQGKIVYRVRERETESYATVFRDVRRRLERESFGEWRGG